MRLRTLLPIIAALLCAAPLSAQEKLLRVDMNIPALRVTLYEGDEILRSYPVAVGKKGHDTPVGNFAISHAEWNPWWRPPASEWARNEQVTPPGPNNPMGRVKLFFLPLYFFHGTPESGSIGTAASHGCVRMLNDDVIALSRLLHERMAPHVTQGQIDRILSTPRQTRRVNFQESVPVTIRYDLVSVEDGAVNLYPDYYDYRSLHSEAVIQALMRAGYDVGQVSRSDIDRLIERGRGISERVSMTVEEAFGSEVASTRSTSVAIAR